MRSVTIRGSDEGPERVLRFIRHVGSTGPENYQGHEVRQRQIGWLGQSGNVYRFDEYEEAKASEPGSFGPLYIDVGD